MVISLSRNKSYGTPKIPSPPQNLTNQTMTMTSSTTIEKEKHLNPLTSSSPKHIRSWLAENHPKQLTLLDKFEMEYLRNKIIIDDSITPSKAKANDRILTTLRTVEFLRSMIGSTKWKTGGQLLLFMKGLGKELHYAACCGGYLNEPAIGNAVRRIMCAVRDEVMSGASTIGSTITLNKHEEEEDEFDEEKPKKDYTNITSNTLSTQMQYRHSLTSMLYAHPQYLSKPTRLRSDSLSSEHSAPTIPEETNNGIEYDNLPKPFHEKQLNLKGSIMEVIQEIKSDLEDTNKNINEQVVNQIFSGEVLFTYGRSATVESFLQAAASKENREFHLIICESAPSYGGHVMAENLSSLSNITITLIHDTAIFAVMSRVNKVLLPAQAVLANGGLVTHSGSNLVALAAHQHSIPVVVITGMFKLCPMYPHEGQDTLQVLRSPCSVIRYEDANDLSDDVEFMNPLYDYIKPDLIHLYVTNVGSFQPSYIYRLLSEYYYMDDWESFE